MTTKIISSTKEFQQEILLRLEILTTEKIHSLNGRAVTYEDVIELDIINTVSSHLVAVFELTTDDVPFEILGPWSMVKVHKELLGLYNKQTKLRDDTYLDILDTVSNKLFISLFTAH